MRRLWLLLAFLLPVSASAQMGVWSQPRSWVAVSYTGPGDVGPAASLYYGFFAYNNAYAAAHGNSMDIKRASDSTSTTITELSNGSWDTATATTFCTSTSCTVTKLYDQSGNSLNCTLSTPSALVFSAIGTQPIISNSATNTGCEIATIPTTSALSWSVVAERRAAFTTAQAMMSAFQTTGTVFGFYTSTNHVYFYSGSFLTATASDSQLHALQGVLIDTTHAAINVDGTETLGSAGNQSNRPTLDVMQQIGGSNPLNGYFGECIFYSGTALSSGQRTALCKNQQSRWGTANFPANC